MEETKKRVINIQEQNFSVYVSETLDTLGFHIEAVHRRQYAWKLAATKLSQIPGQFTYIHAGSSGEGVIHFTKSDLDIMAVNKHVLCIEPRVNDPRLFDRITTLLVEKDLAPPGYCRLKILRCPGGNDFVQKENRIILSSVLTDHSGQKYISSDFYFELCVANHPRPLATPRQGPSSPSQGLGFTQDLVYCFACRCSSVLNTYLQRRRCHQWPAEHVLRKVASLDGHVVPVGNKLSTGKQLEWRICYTLAELELIHSFNDTQTKVYVLLKMFAKSVLYLFKDTLTSYLFKNIILWVSELIPHSLFSADLLLDRLVHCFVFLSVCLKRSFLPNYMIPERNLLSNKMSRARKASLQGTLAELIAEGGSMVFRCPKLRLSMVKLYINPEMIKEEGRQRDNKDLNVIAQSGSQRSYHVAPQRPPLLGVTIPMQWSHIYQNHDFSNGSVMQQYTGNMPKPDTPQEEPAPPTIADESEDLNKEHELILNYFKHLAIECKTEHLKRFELLTA